MKKIILIVAVLVGVCSCSDEQTYDEPVSSRPAGSMTRSLGEAIEIANNAIGMLGENATRACAREVDRGNIHVVSGASTRSGSGADNLKYVEVSY